MGASSSAVTLCVPSPPTGAPRTRARALGWGFTDSLLDPSSPSRHLHADAMCPPSHPPHPASPAPLRRRTGAFGRESRSLPGLSVRAGAGSSGWRPRLLMLHFSYHPGAGLGATIQVAGVSGESNVRSMSDNVRRTYLPRGVGGGGEMPTSLSRRLQGPLAAGEPRPPPLGPREGGAPPGAGAATSAQERGGAGGTVLPSRSARPRRRICRKGPYLQARWGPRGALGPRRGPATPKGRRCVCVCV